MLEEWQYIQKIRKENYFSGKCTFKFRGDFNRDLSDGSIEDFFDQIEVYDVVIKEVSKLNGDEYIKQLKGVSINNYKGDLIAFSHEKEDNLGFKIEPSEIYVLGGEIGNFKRIHTQVDDGEVHGYCQANVSFVLEEFVEVISCKEGYQTGNEKRSETWRGVWKEEYTSDCKLIWTFYADDPPCVYGTPTGKKEQNLNACQIRYEYKDEWCEPYWGPWEKIQDIKDTPTGNKKRENGVLWIEYYNDDCSTYWKKMGTTGRGCLSILNSGFLSQLLLIVASIFLIVPLFIGLLSSVAFWIVPVAVFVLLYWLVRSKYAKYLYYGLGILGWVLAGTVLLLMFYGLLKGFQGELKEDRSYTPPNPSAGDDREDRIKTTDNTKDSLIYHYRKWYDYDQNKYEGSYYIEVDALNDSKTHHRKMSPYMESFTEVYRELYSFEANMISGLYGMLDSLKENNDFSDSEFAEVIVSCIQDIPYVAIIDTDCALSSNSVIQQMLREGVPCEGEIPFGVNSPVQFLADLKGDCDSRTLLLYTILKHYDYDVVIMNSNQYMHSMLGINLPFKGVYKTYKNRKYYFWETTSVGFEPGMIPPDVSNTNYWYIVLD